MKFRTKMQVALALAALTVLASRTNALVQYHETVSLDTPAVGANPWLFTPLISAPAGITPGPIVVPSFWSEENPNWDNNWPPGDSRNKEISKATYTRTFSLPTTMAGKKIKLKFESVNYGCEVRIGGQLVGPKHFQPFAPFEYDITAFVVPDGVTQHALAITVTDDKDLLVHDTSQGRDEYDYPMGTPVWAYQGDGICGPVRIVAAPTMRVEDVYAKPSVSAGTITFDTTVVNDQAAQHNRVWLSHEVYEILSHNPEVLAAAPALTVTSPASFLMTAQSTKQVSLTASWPTAKLWTLNSPTLYRVKSKLLDTAAMVLTDQADITRFGFRQFSIDGNHYSLNGVPFHGWGDGVHVLRQNGWNDREVIEYLIEAKKAYGCRLIRHAAGAPAPSLFYDICDEEGMLCYDEMNWNGQNNNDVDHLPYIAYAQNYKGDGSGTGSFELHASEMISALVKRDRNHPSVVIWSLSNEVFLGSTPGYPDYNFYSDDLAAQTGAITALDTTRPIGCDSDGSLGFGSNPTGTHTLAIKNKHYPNPSDLSTINDNGKKHGQTYDYSNAPDWVLGIVQPDIPLGVGEWMFNSFPSSSDNSANHPANWGDIRGLTHRFYRLAEFSDIRPFSLEHDNQVRSYGSASSGQASSRRSHMTMKQSMSPVAIFDSPYDARGVPQISSPPNDKPPIYNEGATATRSYSILNDDLDLLDPNPGATVNKSIQIDWRVSVFGRITAAGTTTTTLALGEMLGDPYDNDPLALQWTAPNVDADETPFIVSLVAKKQGIVRYSGYYVFLANDNDSSTTSGFEPLTKKGTIVASFDDETNYGWHFHDHAWTIVNGELWQPEVRGLLPNNRYFYNATLDDRVLPYTKFGINTKIAAIDAYKYADLRMSCDVTLLAVNGNFQGAGIGVRLGYPESGAWVEEDVNRRSGYFLHVQKGTSAYTLMLGKATSTGFLQINFATLTEYSPGQQVRLELEARGTTLSGSASCVQWTTPVTVQGTDSTYQSQGYVNLNMREDVAAKYDNVQVGTAPFAPQLNALPAQISAGTNLPVAWTQETDWEQSPATVQYKLLWASDDGLQTGTSTWLSSTAFTVTGLQPGAISFVVKSRDNHGQISAQSQVRKVVVL